MIKIHRFIALAAFVMLGAVCVSAEGNPYVVKKSDVADVEKLIQKHIKIDNHTVDGKNHVVVNVDNLPALDLPGGKAEVKIEEDGANRAIVVRIDGKEMSRVPIPKLDLKDLKLPPLALPNIDRADVRCESNSINGVSNTKVWVNGEIVYDGPGSNSSSVSRNDNGRKSVEVTVDGKVVYRVGQDGGDVKRK